MQAIVGIGLIVTLITLDIQPLEVFLTDTAYVLGSNPVNVVPDWKVVPLTLYSKLAPIGVVTTMVPDGIVQVGCTVALAVGAATLGIAVTIKEIAGEIQPLVVFLTVTL